MAQNVELGMNELTSPAAIKAALAELIASMLFVFAGVGSIVAMLLSTNVGGGGGIVVVALVFGLAIGVLAAGIGPISGGHINSAVTFAMIITGNISTVRGAMYIVAQLIGAVLGMLLLKAFITTAAFHLIPGIGGDILSAAVPSKLAGVGLEAFGTFVLVWTVFATAITKNGNSGTVAPLYIGLAVLIMHLLLIPLTGCGINPSRTFGPAVVMGRWTDFWVFVVGPLIGAALAGLGYTFLYTSGDDPVRT